jgi:hypothetical protein
LGGRRDEPDREENTMSMRTVPSVILCCLTVAAIGCSSQPTAPSSLGSASVVGAAETAPSAAAPANGVSPLRFGTRTPGVIYVTSQGLYYDTFVVRDPLPMNGRFQLIENGQTEFGPGDPGYLGGRWWEDLNGNGIQDPDDHYFLCPLLPPGRPTAQP